MTHKNYNKKAQVWIETAIYTLIGLVIIGILLATATPQIEKIKDKGILDQTRNALLVLDNKVSEVEQAGGSSREVQFTVAKGRIEINAEENTVKYVLEDTRLELSEVGEVIKEGAIYLLTQQKGSRFDVSLTLNYTNQINMTFENQEKSEVLQAGTTPYKIIIENVGDNSPTEKTHIDFSLL